MIGEKIIGSRLNLFGVGGQAEVFKAIEKRTNNVVAFKRILNRLDPDGTARIKREIMVQCDISHPNVMPILDQGRQYLWYTMPIATRTVAQLPLPIENDLLLKIIRDTASGLQEAHSKHYIHRDVTPSNILEINVEKRLHWVVADWGLVRLIGKTTNNRTPSGQEFGTAGFAAPEMWTNAHDVGEYTDIYSLGRIVCWCLGYGNKLTPNVQINVDGVWREFVAATTMTKTDNRIPNMDGVLTSLTKVKKLIDLSSATHGIGISAYGMCPTCGYNQSVMVSMEGTDTEIRKCSQCSQVFKYFRY